MVEVTEAVGGVVVARLEQIRVELPHVVPFGRTVLLGSVGTGEPFQERHQAWPDLRGRLRWLDVGPG